MPEYCLLIDGHTIVPGDVLDDTEGKTKYSILYISPTHITIEWGPENSSKTDVPVSSWEGAQVISLKELDDPNVLFRLRRKPQ